MTPEIRLETLRGLMKEKQIDAYVVPSEDAHASEYLAPCDARRAFITGFTGSAGCAVITASEARCWTDGRYWLSAEKQLGKQWTLMKAGLPEVPTWGKWLKDELPSSSRIGIDPTVIPYETFKSLSKSLNEDETPSSLVSITDNLIDQIWTERPSRPCNQVFQLEEQFSGEKMGHKIARMRDKLEKIGSPGLVISQLDEIAWLFNLRGSDIPYNPVFFSYAILTRDDCTLFINPSSLSESVRTYLHQNDVTILDYTQFWSVLRTFGKHVKEEGNSKAEKSAIDDDGSDDISMKEPKRPRLEDKKDDKGSTSEKVIKTDKVLIGSKTSWAIANALGEDIVEIQSSMVEEAKAKKNATEIEGFRTCNIRDGAALVRYFAWLEEVLGKGESWTEYDAATILENYRRENKHFMGLSFTTISSTGANAAVIHYQPPKQGSSVIERDQMYLCDSGAQYMDGTTDTTRTLHFGTPSDEEKRAFTRVLQGHIGIDQMVFPQGTTGYILDIIARKALWADGLDYRHGTGHGVGSFLNVHEGPQGIGQRPAYNDVPLQAGMVMSNEPGYYADGKWGIRIENVVVVKMAETPNNFGNKGYLEFEHFTMVPIQSKLVQLELLSSAERKWLNDYHAEVLEKVKPILEKFGDERAMKWLEKECAAI